MTHKTTIISRARQLETRIRVKHETKKQIKQHRYRIFLNEQTGYLPGKKKLYRWRRNFIIIGMICLAVPSFQTILFYDTLWTRPDPLIEGKDITIEQILQSIINDLPVICGLCFFMFMFFGICVDGVIGKRWPDEKTIINWRQQNISED